MDCDKEPWSSALIVVLMDPLHLSPFMVKYISCASGLIRKIVQMMFQTEPVFTGSGSPSIFMSICSGTTKNISR